MSTKTTFKRIALVAVASLGFGVLTSVAPAGAADATESTFTSSLSFNTTSITAVGALDATTETKNAAVFRITAIGNGGSSSKLKATESITAEVSAVPTNIDSTKTMGNSKADLNLSFLSGTGYGATFTSVGTAGAQALVDSSHTSSVDQARLIGGGVTASSNGVYFLAVTPADAKTPHDVGFYTVRVRLQDASGFITNYTLKVQFVTSAADSGAVIVPTITGTVFAGDSITFTTTKNMKATLRDANGGLVQGLGTTAYTPTIPTLTADIIDLTTGVAKGGTNVATIADSGAAAVDHVAIATAGTVGTAAEMEAANVINQKGDGTYGITTGVLTAAAADGDSLRVRYGASSASAALTITAAATASTVGAGSFTATGKVAGATANAVTLPVTTKSVTFNNSVTISSVAQTGYNVYYTLAYGASCVLADMSPAKSATPVKATTDSTGVASLVVTNANPLNGCTASVVWSGAATNPGVASGDAQVATWATAAATTAIPSTGNYQAKLASTNTVSWTVRDQFGAAVAGKTVKFSVAGANAPTSGVATATTDATGGVSLTWTDALAVADDTDTVSITAVGSDAPTGSAVVVTYKAALSVVANIKATYGSTDVLVPATNIGGTTGIAVGAADQLDTTGALTGSASAPWVKLTFQARTSANVAVSGVPTTVTVTGAKLIGTDGKLGTTKVVYDNSPVYVLGTTTGTATVTATNGTLTSKATINFVNTKDQDERVVSATESNGVVTVSVKDAFGNAVSGSTLDVTTTGGAVIGASTYGSYKTASDGTVAFNVTGAGSVTAKLASAYSTGKLANSGDILGLVSTPGAPAGVRSATVATTGTAQAIDQAQAATDAAAEATDAANAATDAANAAAEAADAATAAAQDAADAVAALSTQVSEMVNALKKQITALTNLVIKIQKKVKA
jgi:hypothetical protein